MHVLLLRGASAVLLFAIIAVGYFLYERQLAWTVKQKATVGATAWAEYMTDTVPDIGEALRTGTLSQGDLRQFATPLAALGIFRFELFDTSGQRTFIKDLVRDAETASDGVRYYDPLAVNALTNGEQVVSLEKGIAARSGPASYAYVYVPVRTSTENLGVIKVFVDTTAVQASTREAYSRFALLIAGLTLIALAIPTLHWLLARRETLRQNKALETSALSQSQMAREVRHIAELNEWLQLSRSQSELFEMVVGFLTELLPACEGEVYVYSNSRDVLDGSAGWAGGAPQDHIHPEDCWALRRGRAYEYGDSEVGLPCAHARAGDARPYLCLPLLAHGETIGLLHLRQREGATAEQFHGSRRLAQLCAEHLSMAIANVRMRDELQDQSIRDALTGLYNRRHLTDSLRRHMSRAAREDSSVAVLSIDVDHFKRFNDNFGHDAGDMVLRAVGEVLDRETDGNELACRPGGEEFMVVIPDSTIPDALHRAESLREHIQAISLRYGEKTLPSITASIGIALSPDDGTLPQDLMKAADAALYAAKAGGRNRAVLTGMMQIEGEDREVVARNGLLTAAE